MFTLKIHLTDNKLPDEFTYMTDNILKNHENYWLGSTAPLSLTKWI